MWRYQATTSDNSMVYVRFHKSRWQYSTGWSDPAAQWLAQALWYDDDRIPYWPGTFTNIGGELPSPGGVPFPPGYATGGSVPPGGLIPLSSGCSSGISERALRASGHGGTDWLALLNSNGSPKAVPIPDAVAEALGRLRAAKHQETESATRSALHDIVREKIGLHLEGHRGVVKQLRAAVYDTATDAAI